MQHQQMQYSVTYTYDLLHSCYMFRRWYLTIFRELTPIFFSKHTAIQ